MADTFDIAVIGGGPGGYVAAIRAAQLGLKTAVIEREHLGGICLNWGCIPTKALLRSAEIYRHMKHAEAFGLSAPNASFDFAKIVERSRGVAKQLSGGIAHLLKKNKVTVFDGTAKLSGAGKIAVAAKDGKTTEINAKHIIIATGARARAIPGLEADGNQVWSYKDALKPDKLPASLLVVGSGAIGIEFACFYNTFGSKVTVVEALPQILPVEDGEIAAIARKRMEKDGIVFHTGASVKGLKKTPGNVTAVVEAGGKTMDIAAERVLVAIGVAPNVENLGLEVAGVKLDAKGFIAIDARCRASAAGVYAIGDVAGQPCLAHKASHEGILCVEAIAGHGEVHALDRSRIPGCTYGFPQVASLGLSEARAKEQGIAVKIGRFPFVGNGKAVALGEPEGLVKTVFDAQTGELLGAHMVGPEVTEMIQGFGIARTLESTEAELMQTIFPHPTLSEAMHEAVLSAYGRTLHF